jgi:hypothetical protein
MSADAPDDEHVDAEREARIRKGRLVKSRVTIIVVLLVTVLSGRAARAHTDTFGTPDPYWQNLASGSSNGRGQMAADGTTAVTGARHPWVLRAYLYTMGALFVALVVRGVRRVLPELLLDLVEEVRTGGDAIRTVEVLPPSRRRETYLVLGVAAAIFFGALLMIAPGSGYSGSENGPRVGDLLPFQVLFRDAPPPVQRMYREMQEGLLEAESRRVATKVWPAVGTLAAQGIPPFALTRPPYRWSLAQDGVFVNYVGLPEPDGLAFLALVQEPDPNAIDAAPAALLDEVHHRLADGTLLHVSIWFRAAAAAVPADRPLTQPAASGWTQVLVGRQGP